MSSFSERSSVAIGGDHVALDVCKRAAHFFTRIQNILWIEYLLGLCKEFDHLVAVEHRQVGRADDPVVVFSGGSATYCYDQLIHLGRKLEDNLAILLFGEVHERDQVEVAIAHVASQRVDHVVFVLVKQGIQLGQELGVRGGRHHKVVDKGYGVEILHVLAEQGEALAAHDPVLLTFFFILLDLDGEVEVGECLFGCKGFSVCGLDSVFGKLGHEDKLGYAAGRHERRLGDKLDPELGRLDPAHLRKHLGEELDRELEGVLVVGLKRFRMRLEYAEHDLGQYLEIVQKDDHHRAVLLGLNELELRSRPQRERALRATNQLGEVGRARAVVADLPEQVASRILRYLRLMCLDKLGVLGEERIHLAIDRALERLELLFILDLFRVERLKGRRRAVREHYLELFYVPLGLAVLERALAGRIIRYDAAHRAELAAGRVGGEYQPLLERGPLKIPIKNSWLSCCIICTN